MDSRKDGTVCTGSVIQCELKKFLGFLNSFASLYLNSSEIRFAEGIEIYLLFKQRLNCYLGEVDLLVWCKEAIVVTCRCCNFYVLCGSSAFLFTSSILE